MTIFFYHNILVNNNNNNKIYVLWSILQDKSNNTSFMQSNYVLLHILLVKVLKDWLQGSHDDLYLWTEGVGNILTILSGWMK